MDAFLGDVNGSGSGVVRVEPPILTDCVPSDIPTDTTAMLKHVLNRAIMINYVRFFFTSFYNMIYIYIIEIDIVTCLASLTLTPVVKSWDELPLFGLVIYQECSRVILPLRLVYKQMSIPSAFS